MLRKRKPLFYIMTKHWGSTGTLAESQMLLSAKDREGTAFKDAAYFE